MKRVFAEPGSTHGGGRVRFKWQSKHGNFLATCGANRVVNIFDRKGNSVAAVDLAGACTDLDWSKDGDVLAVITDKSADIYLWHAVKREATVVPSGLKGALSFCAWSHTTHDLVVGTSKGSICMYNHQTARKEISLGKNPKRITCGAWSSEGTFALGSSGMVTLNSSSGDTIQSPILQGDPSNLQFYNPPPEAGSDGRLDESKVSVVLDNQRLYVYNTRLPDAPTLLQFQKKYGKIISYAWYGAGKLMLGFSSGYLVVVSTHTGQIGTELFSTHDHRSQLNDIAVCETSDKAASLGDDRVKIRDLSNLTETYAMITLENDAGMLDRLAWSDDGQLLTVTSQDGALYTYLAKLPVVGGASVHNVASLYGLQEVAVEMGARGAHCKVKVPIEPTIVSVGERHLAVALNNKAYFYALDEATTGRDVAVSAHPLGDRSYMASLSALYLNSTHAAALCDGGKLQLHRIEENQDGVGAESRLFPDKGEITAAALTEAFLVFATSTGGLFYFLLEDWQMVSEYQHPPGIRAIYPDAAGTRVVLVDNKGDAVVYSPMDDSTLSVPNFPLSCSRVLWEMRPGGSVFVAVDEEGVHTFVYNRDGLSGPGVTYISKTPKPFGSLPVRMWDSNVTCLTSSGKTKDIELESHSGLTMADSSGESAQAAAAAVAAERAMAMGRFKKAYQLAARANQPALWDRLGRAALEGLDVATAILVYRSKGDAATVQSLRAIEFVEDRNLLSGHVALILGDSERAQRFFLDSQQPLEALNMHRDLLHWEQALQLANTLSKKDIPYLSREYAQQLEFQGAWDRALELYVGAATAESSDAKHNKMCLYGEARCSARVVGKSSRAVSIANEADDTQLYRDVAVNLEAAGQVNEAAALFEKGQLFDRAAGIYIRAKNWAKVAPLLADITSPALHGQYARARESDGAFPEAAQAYEAAKDYLSAIRLYLEKLRNPDEAVRLVKLTGSVEGAKMVARFFLKIGEFESAIQFLVMSQCADEAFKIAQEHNQMKAYATVLGDGGSAQDYRNIAQEFEKSSDMFEAGRYFSHAGEYRKALGLLLQCNKPDGEHINVAIDAVAHAQQDHLTDMLVNHLLSGGDGLPKDKFLFKLHMALKQYPEAARTAIIIARKEQNKGNYRNAHDVLFNMYQQLRDGGNRVPQEMSQNLMLLHSYMLVNLYVKRDHMKAARMLMRVSNSISRFPAHVVAILTQTVIKCSRSGLKESAFDYATTLMQKEYRAKIDAKYQKKIEVIVRKRPDEAEPPEPQTPCPYCKTPVPASQLDCGSCGNVIPYCVATGLHMTTDDWCLVPCCGFPALYSQMSLLLQSETACPMCSQTLSGDDLVRSDATEALQSMKRAAAAARETPAPVAPADAEVDMDMV
eukprot:UC1_evm1s599